MYGGKIGLPELAVVFFIVVVFVLPYVKIFQKAGYSGWLAICMLFPILNIIVLFWFAFSKWPIELQLERLRAGQGWNASPH